MDIKNLETFVMVNEMKSFTQTAARLGFTQSTVSFQIKQLEKELGMPLFERINHTVRKPRIFQRKLSRKELSESRLRSRLPAGSLTPASRIFTADTQRFV